MDVPGRVYFVERDDFAHLRRTCDQQPESDSFRQALTSVAKPLDQRKNDNEKEVRSVNRLYRVERVKNRTR